MTGRRDTALAIGGLGFASFVLAHDILFLAEYGADFRTAMAQTGHGEMWAVTVFSAIGISLAIVMLAVRRLWVLRAAAAAQPVGAGRHAARTEWSRLIGGTARIWVLITLVALVLFVASENWERHSAGLPLPGLAVLIGSPPSLEVIGIFASVAALAASVATLYQWRCEVLVSRARVRRRLRRPSPLSVPPGAEPGRPHTTPLARRIGGRAPPALVLRGTA